MPDSPWTDHDRILDTFSKLPSLDFSKVRDATNGVKFAFPRLTINEKVRERAIIDLNSNRASISSEPRRKRYTLLDELVADQPSGKNAINVLLEAIDRASGKLEYGRTSLDEWNRRLVYANDQAVRSESGGWDIRRSNAATWTEGNPINGSSAVADDWFQNELVGGMEAGRFPSGLVIHGAAGSGKSTILKYLILKNFKWLKEKRYVFSRFELMKFWNRISANPEKIFERGAKKYMAVIHARDLLLHRFCDWFDNGEFRVNQNGERPNQNGVIHFKKVSGASSRSVFEVDLQAFLTECKDEFAYRDLPVNPQVIDHIRNAVSKLADPGASLFKALDELKLRDLHIMIFVLARGKTIVTLYDGLDAVRPEDVLSTTKGGSALWNCACKVMELRDLLGDYDSEVKDAPSLDRKCILVTRNNTLEGLVYRDESWADNVTRLKRYQVAPVAVLPAAVSTARTVITYVPEFCSRPEADRNRLASLLLRPYVRSMLQILHQKVDDSDVNEIQDLFDGNLRKLFRLLSLSLRWTSTEMLSGDYLVSTDYQASAEQLLTVLASDRGLAFLQRKSYRTVETLLVGGAGWFENAVSVRRQQLPGRDDARVWIEANDGHHGVLDNVLNYETLDLAKTIDGHMLIEKVRYLQILKTPMGFKDFRMILSDQLGYPSRDTDAVWKKLLFLMKTGFLNVEVQTANGGNFNIETSRRGALALSLLGNLGYIENVFHQTLFPEPLIGHIVDQPRRDLRTTTIWAARSIRNAFVFLTYFKCLEDNPLGGQRVPPRLRLFDHIQSGLVNSIDAMTNPSTQSSTEAPENPKEIARMALEEIEKTTSHWRERRLIV